MTICSDAYKKGLLHKGQCNPMEVPSAINNADEFRGYFDGYGGNQYNPPGKRQEILEANIKKFNFIT